MDYRTRCGDDGEKQRIAGSTWIPAYAGMTPIPQGRLASRPYEANNLRNSHHCSFPGCGGTHREDSRLLRNRGPRMISGDFSNPVSTLDVLTKDIKLGLALGQSVSANMPLGELCAPFSPKDRNWASAPSTAPPSTRCSSTGKGVIPTAQRGIARVRIQTTGVHMRTSLSQESSTPLRRERPGAVIPRRFYTESRTDTGEI